MNESTLQEKLREFNCRRCNECCKQPGFVYLDNGEAEKIAAELKMDIYEFTWRFCEIQDRRKLILKKLPDESCIFLTAEGCSVYASRPKQCRTFPIRWQTERSFSYCAGLKQLFQNNAPHQSD